MSHHYLNFLGTNPSQTEENLSNTPLLDSLDFGEFDFDLARPWMNDYAWDQPLIQSLPPAGSQESQQGLLTPFSDLGSSFGSDTLVDASFSDAVDSSPTSPILHNPTPVATTKPSKTYPCPWAGCTHKSNTRRDLSRHTASRHEGREKKHTCRKDPRCPRRLEGWVRKDLRDRHEKIHLSHSAQGAAKRKTASTTAIAREVVAVVGLADAEARREKHMRTPREELVAHIMALEDNAASMMCFVALAHKEV